MDNLLLILFMFGAFSYISLRFFKDPKGEILNPLLYLLTFSLLYYILGSIPDSIVRDILGIPLSDKALFIGRVLSVYTCSIYFIFYVLSGKSRLNLDDDFKISRLPFYFLCVILVISSIVGVYFLARYGLKLYGIASTSHRVVTYEAYNEMVGSFPIGIVLNISLACSSVLYLSGRSILYYLPSLFISIFPLIGQSRTYLSTALIGLVICLIIKKPDKSKKYISLVLFLAVSLLAITIKESSGALMFLYTSTAEFSHTYMTIPMLIENSDYLAAGDSFTYYTNPLVKFFGLSQPHVYISEELHSIARTPFSLASNNISEALYYGGWVQAIIQPVIVSFVFYIIYNFKGNRIIKFISLYLICLYMRTAVRGAMYLSFSSLVTYIIFLVLCLYFISLINSKVKKSL